MIPLHLLQFNLIIKFRPRRLGLKLDVLTYYWDVYNKGEYHKKMNLQPMFLQNQLNIKTPTESLILWVASTLDINSLLANIKLAVTSNSLYAECLKSREDLNDPHWSVNDNGFLLYNKQIFVPKSNDLCLQVLQARHNHQLVGHMGQSKTYHLVHCNYSWPKIYLSRTMWRPVALVYTTSQGGINLMACSSNYLFFYNPRNPYLWISLNSFLNLLSTLTSLW